MLKKDSYDYVIIGSGFGGSVSALRLAEKGYSVLVIEKGKRWEGKDFGKTNWNLKKWIWFPQVGWYGIQKLSIFRHVSILSGTGVGGGSLVYANTLPKPKSPFFNQGSWAQLADWEKELNPFYDLAWKMLGATKNTKLYPADLKLLEVGKQMGLESTFEATKVAVYFGDAGKTVKDPYFDGKGPNRTGCTHCGECMTGCRHDAKNTLDKNYLYLAEKLGVEILPEHEVLDIIPQGKNGENGYEIIFNQVTSFLYKPKTKIKAKGVVFSGGVLGTMKLLLKIKNKRLPNMSNRLGDMVRSNNESLIATTTIDSNLTLSDGVAIGSILDVDEHTHVEPTRYGKGSGIWRISMMPMVTEPNFFLRILKMPFVPLSMPIKWIKGVFVGDWGKSTIFLLVMQHLDSTLKLRLNIFGRMKTGVDTGKAPSAFIPQAHAFAKKYAKAINGIAQVILTESITGIPSTAHILGGACMGKDKEHGVIDSQNKVFGYDNMYVFDGSMISANPGVNPSLSITAISERGMSFISAKKTKEPTTF
jgi:cholesterol oxidase